ncbi:MAG: hypothetical protein Q8P46_06820 [Hyphomicrobiales bacterium]|nr:hypothetical protein [Hyphomicrobiales bacterium]
MIVKPGLYNRLTDLLVDLDLAPLDDRERRFVDLISAAVEMRRRRLAVTPEHWRELLRIWRHYYGPDAPYF